MTLSPNFSGALHGLSVSQLIQSFLDQAGAADMLIVQAAGQQMP
jgi:hypothetical protein